MTHKLLNSDWEKIQRAWKQSKKTLKKIAQEHCVSEATIRRHAQNSNWGKRNKKKTPRKLTAAFGHKIKNTNKTDIISEPIQNSAAQNKKDKHENNPREKTNFLYAELLQALQKSLENLKKPHFETIVSARERQSLIKIYQQTLLQLLEYEKRLERYTKSPRETEQKLEFLDLDAARREILGRLARLHDATKM